jgi:uncharacterized secreted protein with C-terminal beta-propeller domain
MPTSPTRTPLLPRSKRWVLASFALLGVFPVLASLDKEPAPAPAPATADGTCRALLVGQAQLLIDQSRPARQQSWVDGVGESLRQAAKDDDAVAGVASLDAEAKPTAKEAPAKSEAKRSRRGGKKASGSSRGPSRYSKTNTQEESVDEGDLVKTNGRFLYHVSCSRGGHGAGCRNEIRVYRTWPAKSTKLVERFSLPRARGAIAQLYFHDDLIVAVSRTSGTRLTVLRTDDAGRLSFERDVTVPGGMVDSRMIGSRLLLATSTPKPNLPADVAAGLREVAGRVFANDRDQQLSALEAMSLLPATLQARLDNPDWIPTVVDSVAGDHPAYSCEDVRTGANGNTLLNLVQVDVRRPIRARGAAVAGYSQQAKVYASEGAFYVTGNLGAETLIQKFELRQKPEFVASGTVQGQLLNQFAMSRHDGHLRVATSQGWASNNVYVLQQQGKDLVTVGKLEGLARNERIFAIRMMGDKGYMVTFRRTDPLYTLDLSNPRKPTVVGELKIPGFSNYLHPLDADHLLAVGQDADARGRSLGLHLQVFDVSDLNNPTRVHHEKLDAGTVSQAQADHHAFMFDAPSGVLAMPFKGHNYWGMFAYKVDAKEGFRKLGRVNHALAYKGYFKAQCKGGDAKECAQKNHWWKLFTRADLAVDRVVTIDDYLYSMSPTGVMVHQIGNKLRHTRTVLVNEPAWRAGERVARR